MFLTFLPAIALYSTRCVISPRYVVREREIADGDLDVITGREGEVFVRDYPRARHQEGSVREGKLLAQVARQLLEGPLHPGGADLLVKNGLAIPQDAHAYEEVPHRVRSRQGDTGSQGAAAVVDLGLRQVQRVLSFYVPGRNVIAGGVADDLHPAVHDEHKLGLRHVPAAVLADAHGLAVSRDPPADGLEEELGPLGVVDLVVDVGLSRLEHAGLAADQVSHPASPDLVQGLQWGQERVFLLDVLPEGRIIEDAL